MTLKINVFTVQSSIKTLLNKAHIIEVTTNINQNFPAKRRDWGENEFKQNLED